jgi:hypothetical protein
MRALDVQQAAYRADQVDRAILAAADAVEGLTQRRFYPETDTRSFDWPNYQLTYPWRLYLEQNELAAQPTRVVTGSLLPVPIEIATGSYIVRPAPESPSEADPPYRILELRRDASASFGNNPTPQLDIAITGDYGFWTRTRAAGQIDGSLSSGTAVVSATDASLLGVGDVLVCDSERMIVSDSDYVQTDLSFLTGITTDKASDRVGTVSDGSAFSVGEVIMVDFEWMLIVQKVGNNIVVKRAWDGSVLSEHTGGSIWAKRNFSVLRGALGTVAASHADAAALAVSEVPGLVNELAVAEAIVWLAQEPAAYAGAPSATASQGSQREPKPGLGLPDLRERVASSRYTRKARSRTV